MLHVITTAVLDMYAYIPTSDFAGSKTSDFVYLYAHFGNTDASQAGFEEWALVNAAPIPEMNALFPIIVFLRWPSRRNICSGATRDSWATYSFHEFTLRCLAEAVTVASFFLESDGAVLQTVWPHA
jgi:hypothetical protein